MIRYAALILPWLACPAVAQDFITVPDDPLSDDDFYRVVACAAAPEQPCAKPYVRWPDNAAQDLSLRIVSVAPQYPNDIYTRIHSAVDNAISQINAAGTVVQMRRAKAREIPDISIHLVAENEGDVLQFAPDPDIAGLLMPSGYVHIWWNGKAQITRSIILFSKDIRSDDITSIVLEEVLQSTGLVTDIDSAYYTNTSIFAENGPNEIIHLKGQDLRAFQQHYTPS